jgi:acetoin utilization deacetylase AcuC-like enzyme
LHPPGYLERPERLLRLFEHFPQFVHGEAATRGQIERVHAPEYLDAIESLEREVWLDADTYAGSTTWEGALLAAGCAIEAVNRGGFALVRPPGHHALPGSAMGFCIFDNVAVAARYAQDELGAGRIAIVDFDVHHGNGTEAIFRTDSSVLFVSLHQWPFYPGTGGPGTSDENTLNVPLPAGSGDDDYRRAFRDAVEPAVRAFDPDLVLVSAGFDAHERDPLAGMRLTTDGYGSLTSQLLHAADELCDGRIVFVTEGGYDLRALAECCQRVIDLASA